MGILGSRHTEETKNKISISNKGKRRSLKMRRQRSQLNRGNNFHTGHHFTKEQRREISNAITHFYNSPQSNMTRIKMSLAKKGSVRLRERMIGINKARKGTPLAKTHKSNISKSHIILWANPQYRDKHVKLMREARSQHPNQLEVKLLTLLNSICPNTWSFVGNGELVIGGKIPDFTNADHKLIEVYGNYWHQGENPQERIDFFSQYGYKTLVIWENEFNNIKVVVSKINNFVKLPKD